MQNCSLVKRWCGTLSGFVVRVDPLHTVRAAEGGVQRATLWHQRFVTQRFITLHSSQQIKTPCRMLIPIVYTRPPALPENCRAIHLHLCCGVALRMTADPCGKAGDLEMMVHGLTPSLTMGFLYCDSWFPLRPLKSAAGGSAGGRGDTAGSRARPESDTRNRAACWHFRFGTLNMLLFFHLFPNA